MRTFRTFAELNEKMTDAIWMKDRPFTANDISGMNAYTHYPTDTNRENSQFSEQMRAITESVINRLSQYGVEEVSDEILYRLARYRQALYDQWHARKRAKQLHPGAYNVGPSNYLKHARPEKADRLERRAMDAVELAKKKLDRALLHYSPNRPISSDNPDAIELLKAKIAKAEAFQDMAKKVNKIVQSKKLSNEQKVAEIIKLGFKESNARKAIEPDRFGRTGVPAYELTNNNANIRRMKLRVAELEKTKTEQTRTWESDTIKIVDSVEDNRVQIYFDSKPSEDIREKLRKNGFKWAPSIGVWQRHRSGMALWWATKITGIKTEGN